jgi:hypothetical protein
MLSCVIHLNSFAQNAILKGQITDAQNRGIPNVSVSLLDENDDVLIYDFTDDNGLYIFKINLIEYKKLKIEIANMGFEKISQILTNLSQPLNFTLKEKSLELEEVVVENEKRVRIANDTTTIKVASFANKTEQTIEDLLKKIPGIEVQKDGSIKAHGKSIDKLLIEGEDMFDKNYKILSKNLDSKVLEAVQILDNFEDNPIFKKFSNSDKVAINLKLKKGLQNVWFGNAIIGSGIVSENIWKESANIGLLRKKIKLFYLGDYNNLGERATDLYTSNANEKSSFSEDRIEYKTNSIYNIPNNDIGIFSKSQGIFNTALLNSISFTSKINKKLTIRGVASNALDSQIQNSSSFTQYSLQGNPMSFSEENFYNVRSMLTASELELTYVPNEKNYITNFFIAKDNSNKTTNNLLFNNEQINQRLLTENLSLYNHFNHTLQLSEKIILNNYLYFGKERVNENSKVKSSNLNNFFNVLQNLIITQNSMNTINFIGLKTKLLYKFHQIDFSNSIQIEQSNQEFTSKFLIDNQNFANYQNNQNLNLTNIFQDNIIRYNFTSKIDLSATLNLQNTNFRTNENANNIFITNPSVNLNIKKTGFGNFTLSYAESNTLPELNQLLPNFQLTDYRSFSQGTKYHEPLKNQTYSFNHYFYNDPKRFSLNTKLFYINSKSIINNVTELTENFIFNSNIQSAGSENYTANFSFVNYIRKFKTASKIETTNSWISAPVNVNSNEFSIAQNFNNSIKYSATTYFSFPINFDFGLNYNYFQTIFQNIKTDNNTKDAFVNVNYKISNTILFESNNNLYLINKNNYSFNNIVLSYTPTESRLSYRLLINNLANHDEFTTISVNNFSNCKSTVQIVPRYILGTIKYRF